MKKFIPLLISGILALGAVACQDASKTSDADSVNNTAKDVGAKTETAAKNTVEGSKTAVNKTTTATKTALTNTSGGTKTIVKNNLEKKFPGSKLDVEEKDGVLTIKGTVPDEATLKKIEPAVKEYKFQGVKAVKVEAKVAGKKA
ncbi:BON domain-containing protein [Calothrix sp. UHCC 0171]|uniref:BON domain-containing protein n=1 Tax=Calothrix sp. UHCC 0171 TaxID=3110245 RepID=UPI002B1F2A4E|nr:BON domain-containing protein [Calothrix sp. UHCC 0171]MEA5569676.1 BON domain-containing protein [Calothrix sp. UHCC 0171]